MMEWIAMVIGATFATLIITILQLILTKWKLKKRREGKLFEIVVNDDYISVNDETYLNCELVDPGDNVLNAVTNHLIRTGML